MLCSGPADIQVTASGVPSRARQGMDGELSRATGRSTDYY